MEDIEYFIKQEECIIASDSMSLAPYGILKDDIGSPNGYGWVAEFLERFVKTKNLLSTQDAIYRLTGFPAKMLKLKDRGYIRPGYFADVIIIDWNKVKNNCSFQKFNVYPSGFEHVVVNGVFKIKNKKRQENNSGRVVRM